MVRIITLLFIAVCLVVGAHAQQLSIGTNMLYVHQHTTIHQKSGGAVSFDLRYEFLPRNSPYNMGIGFVLPVTESSTALFPMGGELTGRYRYKANKYNDFNFHVLVRYLYGRFMSYEVPSGNFSGAIYKNNAIDMQLSPLWINFYAKRLHGFWAISPFVGSRFVFGSAPRNIYQKGNENQVNPFFFTAGFTGYYTFSFK